MSGLTEEEWMIEGNVIHVIVARELKKFFREKSRLFAAVARPVIWLLFVGGGLSRLVPAEKGVDYLSFIFPGILGMTILFSSVFSAISIIWDKEFGYMKEILAAPVSRASVVMGKALSGSILSTLQAVVVLMLFPLVGLKLSILQVAAVVAVSFILSFSLSSVGIMLAAFYDSFESFSVIMNFIVMPMFFLSGAMYPVKVLPAPLQVVAVFNPLTYGIDALKNVIFPGLSGPLAPDFPLALDLAIVVAVAGVFMTAGTIIFSRKG